jgi:CRISPR-associated Csx2 family protein
MATVLVSFIGKGSFDQQGKRNYRKANYKFAADEGHPEYLAENSSLFGVSLLKRLQSCGREVDRWLVMGSALSMWDALLEAIPEENHDELENIYLQIGEAIESRQTSTTQTLLDEWQTQLNALASTKIVCRLVGAAEDAASQERIWKALAETVKAGDQIVLDVTNGLRHQPVIASFMVMLLRWLRGVQKVDLYYGAFELTTKENGKDVCPVIRLPLCNELLEATEAISTLQQTGNFSALGNWFKLSEGDLEKVVFADEVNHPEKGLAAKLRTELEAQSHNSFQATLSPLLDDALNWAGETSLAHIYKRKARFAFEHEQYFQAIALLWEAILVVGCQKFSIPNPTSFDSREDAEKKIKQHLTNENDRKTLQKIDYLRNAIMHGTEAEPSRVKSEVERALRTSQNFKSVFKEGENLLAYLLR